MSDQVESVEFPGEANRAATGRAVKRHRNRGGRPVAEHSKPGKVQVSIQCPRELLQQFEAFSAESGVNRQELFREALELYGSLLQAGMRTFRHPGYRRVA